MSKTQWFHSPLNKLTVTMNIVKLALSFGEYVTFPKASIRGSSHWSLYRRPIRSESPAVFVNMLYGAETWRQVNIGEESLDHISKVYSKRSYRRLHSDALRELLWELGSAMNNCFYYGGNTIYIRQCLENVKLWVEQRPGVTPEWELQPQSFEWKAAEILKNLIQVADYLDERDPREVLLLKHMDDFFELLCAKQELPRNQSTFATYRRGFAPLKRQKLMIIHDGDLPRRKLRKFYGVFRLREGLLRNFTEGRLKSYLRRMNRIGVDSGLELEALNELETGLLIELELFHS